MKTPEQITVTRRESGCGDICRTILADLPTWFGIPASNAAYAESAERGPAWLAAADGTPIGIMVLKHHPPGALEIALMAVRPSCHRRGAGRILMAEAEREARRLGVGFLTVKTLGPSAPDEGYAKTRAFWLAIGFTPLEEMVEIWGPKNPCWFLAKSAAG